MQKLSIFFLYLIFSSAPGFSNNEILLNTWDSKVYNPKDNGLVSLTFEARVGGLTESLNSSLIIPNISKVYFEVTWDNKKQFNVKVLGLPSGFAELKQALEMTMVDKLRFFIPTSFFSLFKDYKVSSKKIDSGMQYTLEDKTYLKEITQMDIFFDQDKKLTKIGIGSSKGREINSYKFEEISSEGKYLLKSYLVENVGIQGAFAMSYDIEYSQMGKFYFPSKITITSQMQSLPGEKGERQIFSEAKSVITFSNFSIK